MGTKHRRLTFLQVEVNTEYLRYYYLKIDYLIVNNRPGGFKI